MDFSRKKAEFPLDFLECKMTCSDEGTLWPLPTGEFSLSKTLIKLDAEDNFVIGSLTMPNEVRSKMFIVLDYQ